MKSNHTCILITPFCNNVAEQRKITARSVFFVGEIGVNDYFLALMSKSIDVAESLVPHIIGTIRSALAVCNNST